MCTFRFSASKNHQHAEQDSSTHVNADLSFDNTAFCEETPPTAKDDVTLGSRDSLEELQMIVGDTTSISATEPDQDVSTRVPVLSQTSGCSMITALYQVLHVTSGSADKLAGLRKLLAFSMLLSRNLHIYSPVCVVRFRILDTYPYYMNI